MPILAYPGAALAGCTVRELVTDPSAQVAAQRALHERVGTTFRLSAMDLSVEAEAFGAEVVLSESEVPTVTGRLVRDEAEIARLAVPAVGAGRTRVYVETVRRLAAEGGDGPVLAGMLGPFTLASRILGISETLVETIDRPKMIHAPFVRAACAATRFSSIAR